MSNDTTLPTPRKAMPMPPPKAGEPPSILDGTADALQNLENDCSDADTANAITASEWLTQTDEPEQPIVMGIFDHGDRVAIVGQSKARKSFYALQLAVGVSAGTAFLGVAVVKQRVLLFNGEIRANAYKRRLRRMLDRMGIEADELDGLVVVNASEDPQEWTYERLLSEAQGHGAQAVIADPAYMLIGDENDQSQVKQTVRDMKQFAAAGVTLVSVFHSAKGQIGDRQAIDRISGSGVLARDASTIISLCEHATEADHVVVTVVTRNHPPKGPHTIRFDDGAFEVTDVAAVEKTSRTKPKRVFTLEQLKDCFTPEPTAYACTVTRVAQVLGCGRDRAKAEIKRAVVEGVAYSTPSGSTTLYSNRTETD